MSELFRALGLKAVLFCTALSANSSAQGNDALEEVSVIGTRIERPEVTSSTNVTRLEAQQLGSVNPQHIQSLMSRVPGVSMQRGNGQESLPAIRSAVQTGAGACGSVLVLEEAIAVRGAGFCNINELFDTHFEQAALIEVVRGANTAFYGSNALNGSVNVVLPSTGTNRASLEVGANQYRRAKAAFSYSTNQQSYGRWYVTLSEDGGFRDDAGYQQGKLSWRHTLEAGPWQLNGGFTYTDLDQQTAGFITGLDSYRDPSLIRRNLDPQAFRKSRSLRAWLKGERQFDENSVFQGALYLRDTDMAFLQHFLPGDPLEQNNQSGVGWQSAFHLPLSDQLRFAIGVDGEISQGELLQTQDAATVGSAFLQETVPMGTHYDYQVDSEQLSVFAHLDWQASYHWQILTGLRIETLHYDYDNRSLTGRSRDDGTACGFGGCRYSRPADRNDRFTHVSPKLEVRYQPNNAWRWSLSIADSFRAPQATELYRLQRAQSVADLDVVEALSVEASLRYRSETLQLDASLFDVRNDNIIIRDSNFFNIDGQSTRSQGIELSLDYALNERWRWRLLGSLADHEYTSDQFVDEVNINGRQVDTAPRLFGSAMLSWQGSNGFNAELELQRMGSYYTEPTNQHEYPGHSLLHIRAAYQLSERWEVFLRGLNLTNQRYAERADYTSFTQERYFPGEPRSFFAEIAYEF